MRLFAFKRRSFALAPAMGRRAAGFALGGAVMFAGMFTGIAGFLACAPSARAAETPDFFTGVRQLGMGGAYSGVVNDETAVLTNPAGLGKIRDFTFNLVNPQGEGSFKATDIFSTNNYQDALQAQGILDALNKAKGTPYDLGGSVFPSITLPNFGVGALLKKSYFGLVSADGQTFTLDYTSDWAAAMAINLRFFGGVMKLGVAGRVVDRTEAHISAPATSTGLSLGSLQRSGMGLATDIGLILTAPVVYLPSLAVVARDVGGTSYNLSSGMFGATTYRPADTPMRIDASISFFPIVGKSTRASFTVEGHDLTNLATETDTIRRLHVGVELNASDFFFLRGGMNGRYWTGGVEFATRFFQLQGASYGQEVGTATAPLEDRRWVGSFAIRF